METYGNAIQSGKTPTVSTVPPPHTNRAITERNLPTVPPPAPDLGKSAMLGVNSSAADFYNLLANVPGLLDKLQTGISEATGTPKGTELWAKAEKVLRDTASYYQPTPEEMADQTTILQKVVSGVTAAPNAIATYLPATEVFGPVVGMALICALRNTPKGIWETLVGGVKGAATGMGLGVAGQMSTVPRQMASGGALFGGQTALEGGSVSDIAANTITGAGLMAFGNGKQPDVNIADQLPSSAWPDIGKEKQNATEIRKNAGQFQEGGIAGQGGQGEGGPNIQLTEKAGTETGYKGEQVVSETPKGVIPSGKEETSQVQQQGQGQRQRQVQGQGEVLSPQAEAKGLSEQAAPSITDVPPTKIYILCKNR